MVIRNKSQLNLFVISRQKKLKYTDILSDRIEERLD